MHRCLAHLAHLHFLNGYCGAIPLRLRDRIEMSPIFPAAKVGAALLKTLAKPVSSRIQSLARTDDFWRGKTVALGQALNVVSRQITRIADDNKTRRAIPALKDDAALDWGATFIGESFVFGVTTLIIISEYQRAAKKDREHELHKRIKREEWEAQRLRDIAERERRLQCLENHIEFLERKVNYVAVEQERLSNIMMARDRRDQAEGRGRDLTSEESLERLIEGSLSTRLAWPRRH